MAGEDVAKDLNEEIAKLSESCDRYANLYKECAEERDRLLFQNEQLQNYLWSIFKKDEDGHWRMSTSGEGTWDDLEPLLTKTEKRKHQIDTCENYRRDGAIEIQSRYCSEFEADAQVHAPTCQFFRK